MTNETDVQAQMPANQVSSNQQPSHEMSLDEASAHEVLGQSVVASKAHAELAETETAGITRVAALEKQFALMQSLSREAPMTDWQQRLGHLDALERMLSAYKDRFAEAVDADFGHRSVHETQFAEMFPCFQGIKHAKKHGKGWMKTRRVGISALFMPAHNEIQPQPLGVVGVIVPWNYPLYLSIGPMIDALTAGNRLLIKMSEAAPRFAQVFANAVAEYFDPDVVSVALGEVEMAERFSQLPFDHLLYTGSTAVGRKVMAAAAPNLTPVTLELGGKSPVIVLDDANLENTVNRIMMGKLINAGQTCIAPDYVLLKKSLHDEFIQLATQWVAEHYPNLPSNEDYSRIINARQFQRLQGYLDELRVSNTAMSELINHTAEAQTRLLPPVIVSDPPLDSGIMTEEIFGPLLPLVSVDNLDEAIQFVNDRERPLALYVFGHNSREIDKVRKLTVSGGVCVNETLLHVAQHELPFGGVGPSGMGAYHGQAGFERFSHMKPVFVQSKLNGAGLLLPPYGDFMNKAMSWLLK